MQYLAVALCGEFKAVVFKPIGEDDVASPNDHIVACSLLYDAAVDLNVGSLTLHKHKRSCLAIEDNNIGTLCSRVDVDGVLLSDTQSWHVAVRDEELHNVATYPLLGSEHHITLAYGIEDHRLTISLNGSEFYRWKIEFGVLYCHKYKKSCNFDLTNIIK